MRSHPIHAALAHFPIGAWGIATGFDVLGLVGVQKQNVWLASTGLIGLGLCLAIITMAAGAWDLSRLMKRQSQLFDRVVKHAMIMGLTWCIYLASLILRFQDGQLIATTPVPIILSVIAFASLMLGGWLGGDLVYGHGANVAPVIEKDT